MYMRSRSVVVVTIFFFVAILASSSISANGQSYSVAGALKYQNGKDWQGLLRYANAWTKAEPNSVDAWAFVGNAYTLGLNQPEKGIDPLKRCVAIQPNSAPAWHALGVTYIMAKQYGPAVDAIKHAIQINPNQPTYYNNLAVAYSDGGAFKSALATLDQEKPLAARLNKSNVWYVLGNGYVKLGALDSAIPAYRQVLQSTPNFAQGWTNLGAALQFNGDDAGAKSAYQRGKALGDPLAGQNLARLQAAEQQAQARVTYHAGSPNVSHMYDYYHGVDAGVDISRSY
jgi:tetratricopeptide (TPR) repeat protein